MTPILLKMLDPFELLNLDLALLESITIAVSLVFIAWEVHLAIKQALQDQKKAKDNSSHLSSNHFSEIDRFFVDLPHM